MNWKSIEYFLRVADVGGITVAARDLGIAQPALSRHIRRLEEEVGVAMFHRLPKGVRLTEAGTRFRERCRSIVHEFAQAKCDLLAERRNPEGEVALGLADTLSGTLAARLAKRMRGEAPGVRLRLADGESALLGEALAAGRLHAAILSAPTGAPDVEVLPLGSEPLALFCARRLLPPRAYTIDEIAILPLVMCVGIRDIVDRQIFRFGKRLKVEIEADCMDAVRSLVLKGIGPTLLPVSALRDDVASGAIQALPVADVDLHRVLAIVHPRYRLAPAPAAVVRAVRTEMALLRAEGVLTTLPEPGPERRATGGERYPAPRPPAEPRSPTKPPAEEALRV